jgi:hypothetical protein
MICLVCRKPDCKTYDLRTIGYVPTEEKPVVNTMPIIVGICDGHVQKVRCMPPHELSELLRTMKPGTAP